MKKALLLTTLLLVSCDRISQISHISAPANTSLETKTKICKAMEIINKWDSETISLSQEISRKFPEFISKSLQWLDSEDPQFLSKLRVLKKEDKTFLTQRLCHWINRGFEDRETIKEFKKIYSQMTYKHRSATYWSSIDENYEITSKCDHETLSEFWIRDTLLELNKAKTGTDYYYSTLYWIEIEKNLGFKQSDCKKN